MRSRLTLVWSSIGGVRPPNSQLQNASMSTRISVPSPPESLVNNKFTKKLRKLYAKKLNSGEILPEPIKLILQISHTQSQYKLVLRAKHNYITM